MKLDLCMRVLLAAFGAMAAGCASTSGTMSSTSAGAGGGGHGGAGSGGHGGASSTSTSGGGMGGGIAGSSASSGTGGGLPDGGDGGSCGTHCSSDLHSVLDCNNQVLTTCPADQGCGTTGCVPACQAALENKLSIGCEYYAVDPDIIEDAKGACFAAYIANTSNVSVTIQVDRAGQALPSTIAYVPTGSGQSITYTPLAGELMPGEVAIVFLGGDPSAPIAPCPAGVDVGYPKDASVTATGLGDAFHITTSAPVAAFDIFPYGGGSAGATSATLLLPTAAWDTNYLAVDAYAQSQIAITAGADPSIDIVASADDTHVTILPTVPIVGGNGVSAANANQPVVYALNKGQYLQITQPKELIGSVIQADKPVGHWAGSSGLNIPVDISATDSAHQQIPPVRALGHEYVAVRYRDRFAGQEESPPWRLVGAVDGTVLTYDPAPPPGAPMTLAQGQFVEFDAGDPFTVASQDDKHPFYMAAFMTGADDVNPEEEDSRGDPEFVNVVPPQQFLSAYTFFTDPTYPETSLVLIRTQSTGQFEDVSLDCAGTLSGWTPIGSAGTYEYARLDLVTGNFQGQNGCDNGVHTIESNGSFGVAVWGWGSAATGGSFGCTGTSCGGFYSQYVSYSFPAGASVLPINQVVIPTTPRP